MRQLRSLAAVNEAKRFPAIGFDTRALYVHSDVNFLRSSWRRQRDLYNM